MVKSKVRYTPVLKPRGVCQFRNYTARVLIDFFKGAFTVNVTTNTHVLNDSEMVLDLNNIAQRILTHALHLDFYPRLSSCLYPHACHTCLHMLSYF